MDLKNGLGHLCYSTLVHAGDTWEEMNASLREFVPKVKARFSPNEPLGVSLRISAASAKTLTESAETVKTITLWPNTSRLQSARLGKYIVRAEDTLQQRL